ncbi:hypothetical protein DFP83_10120 [Idiomarina fontislapidosi]|uniref:Lipoprotein n=1 Tax=Idiomarina fontislapidosi TaxID=263723 RepID=A0A432YAV7_9GAMM|nr:hypothetical protein DFP83_10120 [Idiomarina fontislapidosi]RUO58041.1 hypothetical protein CWE25_00115 [Idiomarina fontislapidosi]|tara:strand:+ start:1063 stop:1434 length:372 start_codon:yes stop_codon:yes gene_type:complete
MINQFKLRIFIISLLLTNLVACTTTKENVVATYCYATEQAAVAAGSKVVNDMLREYRVRTDSRPGFGVSFNTNDNDCGSGLGAVVMKLPDEISDKKGAEIIAISRDIFTKHMDKTDYQYKAYP